MCSVAKDKKDLSVGERLLSSLHWQCQNWSPWCILTCVASLCARAEIQPGYLGAAVVTVQPQKLQAMLGVCLYYTILPHLLCLVMFCRQATVATKSIHHVLNTSVTDANFCFLSESNFKASSFSHRSYLCSWKITFYLHLFTFFMYHIHLMTFSFHLSGIHVVVFLSPVTVLW